MNIDSLFLNLNILSWSKIKTIVESPEFLRIAITASAQFLKIPFVKWPKSDSYFPLHLLSPCYISSCHAHFWTTCLRSKTSREWALKLGLCLPSMTHVILISARSSWWLRGDEGVGGYSLLAAWRTGSHEPGFGA